jgi:poly-gamma-glutamate capsule biosynthesis protein CapA/YwtB (metallophosphatase superfamily)
MSTATVALAGDTMLGRRVADRLRAGSAVEPLVEESVAETMRRADLTVLNLECCISDRGARWPDPLKPFFFRAPPAATKLLRYLGVDCVSLANNHALDYGYEALTDTCRHLASAGIATIGAGKDLAEARQPVVLEAGGLRVGLIGITDHPCDYAAAPDRAGVAVVDLSTGVPDWLTQLVRDTRERCDVLIVTPHWGPNMVPEPLVRIRRAARELLAAGASLVAGHSAHVFHGVADGVLFDLGDFLDDYAVDPRLRNDLGLLWLVELDVDGPIRLEALPLALDYCFTRVANAEESTWIARRLQRASAALGERRVTREGQRLIVSWR